MPHDDRPSFHAYRRLDLTYVDHWSLGLDLSILLSTVPIVIGRAIRSLRPLAGQERPPSPLGRPLSAARLTVTLAPELVDGTIAAEIPLRSMLQACTFTAA